MKIELSISGMKPAQSKEVNDFLSRCDLGITGAYVHFANILTGTIKDDMPKSELENDISKIEFAYQLAGCKNIVVIQRVLNEKQ